MKNKKLIEIMWIVYFALVMISVFFHFIDIDSTFICCGIGYIGLTILNNNED